MSGLREALSIVRIAHNPLGCLAIRSVLPIIRVMPLSKFIWDHMEELLSDWELFAQTLLPVGKTLNQAALRDDAEKLLRAVALDMETAQGPTEQPLKSKGAVAPWRRRPHTGMPMTAAIFLVAGPCAAFAGDGYCVDRPDRRP